MGYHVALHLNQHVAGEISHLCWE